MNFTFADVSNLKLYHNESKKYVLFFFRSYLLLIIVHGAGVKERSGMKKILPNLKTRF